MDRVDDCLAPSFSDDDVAGSDPATDPIAFQYSADCVGDRFILGGVANEDVVAHQAHMWRHSACHNESCLQSA
jgi:hypothetical protein